MSRCIFRPGNSLQIKHQKWMREHLQETNASCNTSFNQFHVQQKTIEHMISLLSPLIICKQKHQKIRFEICEDLILHSYGHLSVITGYKWDYIFYKWGYKYL